jgi:2C-methyl-D-erythritol 2,4-cyclodiphosphate synthase
MAKQKKEKEVIEQVSIFQNHFSPEDMTIFLEIAKIAMNNKQMFTTISEDLDLSDDYLHDLFVELEQFLENKID